jgi:hypothetical protein
MTIQKSQATVLVGVFGVFGFIALQSDNDMIADEIENKVNEFSLYGIENEQLRSGQYVQTTIK